MKVSEIIQEIINFRRHLHQHPELSKQEYQTQQAIMRALEKHGIEYEPTTNTGVIGHINKGKPGVCVALRADIDALPIKEKNEVSYKSLNEGVMHACGHDAHTSILLGVGIILNNMKEKLNGSVKLIFQPDEEVSGGAKRVVKEGHLDDVDYVLGLHVMPYLEVGEVEVRHGALNAETGSVEIEVIGQGAHAAYPEQGIDSIVVMAQLINQIQSIFTRSVSPLEQSVLSFGKIHGGTKSNIIADRVLIEGTLRTLSKDVRNTITKRITEVCDGVALANKATINPVFHQGYPLLLNDVDVTNIVIANAEQLGCVSKVIHKQHPSMGGEDFGYYQDKAKGAFFHLGCGRKEKGITSHLHTDLFDIDEACLEVGIELQVQNVLSLINRN